MDRGVYYDYTSSEIILSHKTFLRFQKAVPILHEDINKLFLCILLD